MKRFDKFKSGFPNFEKLKTEVLDAINRSGNWLYDDPLSNPDNQIMIQTRDNSIDDWFGGVGRSNNVNNSWTTEFCCTQPSLIGSAIEEYLYWLEVPVFRTRIMVMRPKTSYSLHFDSSPRVHLPVITNTHAYFIFKEPAELIHMPADGTAYWVDTRHTHSYMNGSDDIRIHLVSAVEFDINKGK